MADIDFKIEQVDGYELRLRSLKGKEPYVGLRLHVPSEKLKHPTLIIGGWFVTESESLGDECYRVKLRPRGKEELGLAESIDEDVFRDLYSIEKDG